MPDQSLFFNKKQASSLQLYFNKRLWDRCFPVNFGKFLRTHFLIEQLWWLLLNFTKIAFSKYEFGISFKKQFEKSQTKQVDEEDEILNWSVFSNEKKKKIIRNENNGQTNIFVVPFVVIRCYSLSLVVALVDNRFYSLSLDVLLVCLFLSDSFSTVLSSPSFVCSFIFHGLTSKVAVFERSFFDLNNLMRILWNNMKMF